MLQLELAALDGAAVDVESSAVIVLDVVSLGWELLSLGGVCRVGASLLARAI